MCPCVASVHWNFPSKGTRNIWGKNSISLIFVKLESKNSNSILSPNKHFNSNKKKKKKKRKKERKKERIKIRNTSPHVPTAARVIRNSQTAEYQENI